MSLPIWENAHQRPWGSYPKEELVRWFSKDVKSDAKLTVLDLGSGQGASSWYLEREGASAIQLDGSLNALKRSQARFGVEGLPYKGVEAKLTQLPFRANTFDAVVDVVSMAHNSMADIFTILGEVVRVLKPGGHIFSMFPTLRCSRRPFMHLGKINFFEELEVYDMFRRFNSLRVLTSSYQLNMSTTVENWVVTATRR